MGNNFLDKMGGRANDFDDEDMDFAGGIGEEENKEKNSDIEEDSDGEAPDMDTQENSEEDEPTGLDGEDDDNFKDLSSGDEGEQMDDGDDDFDEEGFGDEENDPEDSTVSKIKVKAKKGKPKFPKFDPNDLSSLFADAEEFAHLLDENEDEGMGTSVATKDKASKKQLKWEDNRENHMKGPQSWKNKKKGKKPGGGGAKNFKKSKPTFMPPKKKLKK